MNPDMMEALQALATDRDIPLDALFAALADALETAYKRSPGAHEFSWVTIDPDTMEIRVFAQDLDEEGEPVGDEFDVTPDDFGRIAAQTTRQVMTQRIREAERDLKYEEYAGREGDIVTGMIQQTDARYTLLDLGRVEALLPQAEQVPYERPEANTRLKAYIVEVRKTAKGPQIVVSRTHPGLIKRLFELEVPEIADGVVEIKACAREPGHRTKISVASNDPNVDPVGACVGARGARVRMVVNELRGEKIDIVPFSEDPVDFVMKALSPAKPGDAGYAPPTILKLGGVEQLVQYLPTSVTGLEPKTGRKLWSVKANPGQYSMSIMAPRQDGSTLFAGSEEDGVSFEVDGDKATELWRVDKKIGLNPVNMTPYVETGTIYGVDQPGMLRAVDLKTGNRLWYTFEPVINSEQEETYNQANAGTAFLVKNGDRFFIFNEKGSLVIAKLSREKYEEVSRTKLVEPTGTAFGRKVVWSHPAFADKCLFVRNDKEIACFSLAK